MLGKTPTNANWKTVTAILAAATLVFSTISSTTLAAYADSEAELKALPNESLVDDGNSQLVRLKFKLQEGDFLDMIRVSVDGAMIAEFDAEGNILDSSPALELVFGSVTMLSDGYALGPSKGKFVIAMDKLELGVGEHEAMAEVILDGDTLGATDEFVLNPSEPALPDLVAKYFFAPSTIKKPLKYWTFTVETNEGLDDAKNHQVKVYLSEDDTLDAGDKLLGQRGIGGLEVGDFNIIPIKIKVGKNTDTGTQYLLVKIDANEKIEEQSENNNVLSNQANITPF
jgi:hypothetical protein